VTQAFPRRDADGRAVSLGELAVAAAGGTVLGFAALLGIDGLFALVGLGSFGRVSGWLCAVLPALLFFDDLRAWRGYGVRIAVAVVAAVVALGLGLVVASLVAGAAPVVSGAVGALVAALIYSLMWFVGIRLVTGGRP
jgi:hypothetical protein